MPHVDELLGVTTFAAAGMAAALALGPLPSGVAAHRDVRAAAHEAIAAAGPRTVNLVRLSPSDVVRNTGRNLGLSASPVSLPNT